MKVVSCGGGGSVTMAVGVRSEIDGTACCVSVCVGVPRRRGGEEVDVVDGADLAGAWVEDDAVG